MTKEEILKQCTVSGNIVKLPDIVLDRKLYLDVAKSLELIGGKWKGGKTFGFVFQEDPTSLLEQIANGETRDLKKEYQFFQTPAEIADMLVQMANIPKDWESIPNFRICEPSAGQGAIVKAIKREHPDLIVYTYELMPLNRNILSNIPGIKLANEPDFLLYSGNIKFDRIVANPPFAKNQDIDHVYKMFELLKEDGTMVSVTSPHWVFSNNKKEIEFRQWLEEKNAFVDVLPKDAFKESGTSVETRVIVITK